MPSLKLFILIFKICLWTPFTSTLQPRIFAASDYFIVLNGQDVRKHTTDDRGVFRKPRTTLDKLQVLDNDVILRPPREETCVVTSSQAARQPNGQHRMPSYHHYQDVHKVCIPISPIYNI